MTAEVTDEMLMALADGELPEAEAARLSALIAKDPALARRYAPFAETRAALRAAFPAGETPERLVAAIRAAPAGAEDTRPAAEVIAFRPRPALRAAGPLALAASLLLAVGIGGFLAGRSGVPAAAGPEAALLALAAAPTGTAHPLTDGGEARALASFETGLGLCRMIGTRSQAGAEERLVACRDEAEGGWRIALRVAAGGGGYLPASDAAAGAVEAFLDSIAAGPALSPEEEARALGR